MHDCFFQLIHWFNTPVLKFIILCRQRKQELSPRGRNNWNDQADDILKCRQGHLEEKIISRKLMGEKSKMTHPKLLANIIHITVFR